MRDPAVICSKNIFLSFFSTNVKTIKVNTRSREGNGITPFQSSHKYLQGNLQIMPGSLERLHILHQSRMVPRPCKPNRIQVNLNQARLDPIQMEPNHTNLV